MSTAGGQGRHRRPEQPPRDRRSATRFIVVLVVLGVCLVVASAWWAATHGGSHRTEPAAAPTAEPSASAPTTAPPTSTRPTRPPGTGSTGTGSTGTGPTGTGATTPGPTGSGPPDTTFTVSAQPGVPAGSQLPPRRPTAVILPSGTSVPVKVATTSRGGRLEVPDNIDLAGWWDGGTRIGDSYGAMVVASHVDSTTQGLGPFAQLLSVQPGDQVTVTSATSRQIFDIDTVTLVPKTDLDTSDALFAADGSIRLVLITCAGTFDPDAGGYQDLAVVTAVPAGPATRR